MHLTAAQKPAGNGEEKEDNMIVPFHDTQSVSEILTEILPVSVFLPLTHSVGIYCGFWAKEYFSRVRKTEGA